MSLHPPASAQKANLADESTLSEMFRAWHAQPRKPSSLLLWWCLLLLALLCIGAAVVLGVFLVVKHLSSARPAFSPPIPLPHADAGEVWGNLARMPVQQQGRVKPFATFCQEAVRAITGEERFEGQEAVAVLASWLLLHEGDPNQEQVWARRIGCDWEHHPFLLCPDPDLREALYREQRGQGAALTGYEKQGKHIEPAVLRDSRVLRELLDSAAARLARDARATLPPLEQQAREVQKRFKQYERIRAGGRGPLQSESVPGDFGVAALGPAGSPWLSLACIRALARDPSLWDKLAGSEDVPPWPRAAIERITRDWLAFAEVYRTGSTEEFNRAAATFQVSVQEAGPPAEEAHLLARELWFHQYTPFRWAWWMGLLAAGLLAGGLLLARWPWVGQSLSLAGLAAHALCLGWAVLGLFCQVTISGRPALGTLEESLLWVAFLTALFGLILESIYRKRVIALAAVLVSALGFFLADQLPTTFSPAGAPVHLFIVVSSYAAFALAWGIGNLNLVLLLFAPQRFDLTRALARFCYRTILLGAVLLAAGTLLGAIWAWAPRDVWALVALLCYLIPLHARHLGWVEDFGVSLGAVLCFGAVVLAWCGAGLPSQGLGGSNTLWLYWAGLVNASLALVAGLRYLSARPLLGMKG